MALMACVGSRAREALLLAAEEAVKESAAKRLESLLTAPGPGGSDGLSASDLAQRHLLHQAAWLGHTACVRLLLDHGAEPGNIANYVRQAARSRTFCIILFVFTLIMRRYTRHFTGVTIFSLGLLQFRKTVVFK